MNRGFGILDGIWTALAGVSGWALKSHGVWLVAVLGGWMLRHWPNFTGLWGFWPLAFVLAPLALVAGFIALAMVAGVWPYRRQARGFSDDELDAIADEVEQARMRAGLPTLAVRTIRISSGSARYSRTQGANRRANNGVYGRGKIAGPGALLCI